MKKLFLVLAIFSLFFSPVLAKQKKNKKQKTKNTITLHFEKTPIKEALKTLAEKGNFNLLFDQKIKGKVSLHLEKVSAEAALNLLALQMNLQIHREGTRSYRIGTIPRRVYEFQNAELPAVLDLLARQAGMNIVISSQVRGRVNCNLAHITPLAALKSIVKTACYALLEEEKLLRIGTSEEINHYTRTGPSRLALGLNPQILQRRISIKGKDRSVRDVFLKLALMAEIDLVISPEVEGSLSFSLKDIPWRDALQILLEKSGCEIKRGPGGTVKIEMVPTCSLEFSGELAPVLDLLARQSGANLIVHPEVRGKVFCNFRDLHWKRALHAVVEGAGYEFRKVQPGIFMVASKGKNTLPPYGGAFHRREEGKNHQRIVLKNGRFIEGVIIYKSKDGKKIWVNTGEGRVILKGKEISKIYDPTGKKIEKLSGEKSSGKKNFSPNFHLDLSKQKKGLAVTLKARDVPLKTLLTALGARAEVHFLLEPSLRKRITIDLKGLPWKKALDVILFESDLEARRLAPKIYQISETPTINMEFAGGSLSAILDLLSRQAGINLIHSPLVEGRLTLNFREVPYRRALKALAEAGNFRVVEAPGKIFCIVPPSFPKSLEKEMVREEKIPLFSDKKVSLQVVKKPLSQILSDLSQKTSINLIAHPLAQKRISLTLKEIPLGPVLKILAERADCQVKRVGPHIWYFYPSASISMEFSQAELAVVLDLIARQAEVNFLLSPRVTGRVTCNLRDVEWKKATRALLSVHGGWELQRDDERVFRVMARPEKKIQRKKRNQKFSRPLKKSRQKEKKEMTRRDLDEFFRDIEKSSPSPKGSTEARQILEKLRKSGVNKKLLRRLEALLNQAPKTREKKKKGSQKEVLEEVKKLLEERDGERAKDRQALLKNLDRLTKQIGRLKEHLLKMEEDLDQKKGQMGSLKRQIGAVKEEFFQEEKKRRAILYELHKALPLLRQLVESKKGKPLSLLWAATKLLLHKSEKIKDHLFQREIAGLRAQLTKLEPVIKVLLAGYFSQRGEDLLKDFQKSLEDREYAEGKRLWKQLKEIREMMALFGADQKVKELAEKQREVYQNGLVQEGKFLLEEMKKILLEKNYSSVLARGEELDQLARELGNHRAKPLVNSYLKEGNTLCQKAREGLMIQKVALSIRGILIDEDHQSRVVLILNRPYAEGDILLDQRGVPTHIKIKKVKVGQVIFEYKKKEFIGSLGD